MTLVRRLARPLLAASFVHGGVAALRSPQQHAEMVRDSSVPLKPVPQLGLNDDVAVVRANAALQIGAGLLLATGRVPRLASLALAVSLVPTTLAGNDFWSKSDPAERGRHKLYLLKDAGLLGGLLLAGVDTEGRESLPRRARRAGRDAKRAAKHARKDAARAAADASRRLPTVG